MAKEYPYFKWFPKDAEADEKYAAMTDTELGFFHRCLNRSWMNEGLPEDPEERWLVLKTPPDVAVKLWRRVGRSFIPSDKFPGKLVNPRQEIERCRATEKSRTARNSANLRWHPESDGTPERNTDAHANALPNATANGKAHNPTPNSNGKMPAAIGPFEQWWTIWCQKRGTHHKQQALQAWISVVNEHSSTACIECTQSYLASLDDPARGYNPHNFLFEHAKDGFKGRWPEAGKSRPNKKETGVERMMNLAKKRISEGRPPL